jgi:plasmid stabilization system protein ParE
MEVSYQTEARSEGLAAAAWYEMQQDGLSGRFLAQWRETESRMASNPECHRCFEGELRKCRFSIFPYALVFRIKDRRIQVLAVMHMSREPRYWRERLLTEE